MTGRAPTIDSLLGLVPDAPSSVLSLLEAHPELASKQDGHGYSLLHAAASYEQMGLVRTLIRNYHVDPNMKDEDGETCLFAAESSECAKELIDLGVEIGTKNNEGQTAAEKLDDEDEQPLVAAYLLGLIKERDEAMTVANGGQSAEPTSTTDTSIPLANGEAGETHPPPPLPNGVQVSIGTMGPDEVGEEPDAEFRRRIEELAARQDFDGEESQRELRNLVSDAVSDFNSQGQRPAARRRLG